jgi:hypothetical protein
MKDTRGHIPRAAMGQQERHWRSLLAQIAAQRGLLRGSLQLRQQTCGKPNCKCTRGQKHQALYVVFSKDGRYRQLYVPRQWEQAVRQWVGNYRQLRDLTEKVSEFYAEKVRTRQG